MITQSLKQKSRTISSLVLMIASFIIVYKLPIIMFNSATANEEIAFWSTTILAASAFFHTISDNK